MDRHRQRGQLTIFASYAPGAGKCYAMLERAGKARDEGRDVVIGWLGQSTWLQTQTLAHAFEILPATAGGELDLDACLSRMPQLVLIHQLAHRNGEECRHMKRYQDVEELLQAGIDVYATLDVQHIESLQDTVAPILGYPLDQRIPDRVFDQAGEVEFLDIEPERLLHRLEEQQGPKAEWEIPQLSALREIALRRCAHRCAIRNGGGHRSTEYRAHEHVLVCLSSSPSNERIIRTAARMAGAFRGTFTALFVETEGFSQMSQGNRDRLQANIHLAQKLGASIETVYGDDVAYQIAQFSRLSGVTRIVLGRSGISYRGLWRKHSLTERLIALIPELDIHIIPDSGGAGGTSDRPWKMVRVPMVSALDLLKSGGVLVLATVVGHLFDNLGFTEPNIITLYLLGVMLVSVSTKSWVCSFISSVVAVLTFNFFFTEPRFSLQAYDSGYPVTFLVMFLASLLTGSLASRLKSHAQRSAQVAWRTKLLFETDQSLQMARTPAEILTVTAEQLLKIFQRDIVAYPIREGQLGQPEVFWADEKAHMCRYDSVQEREVAQWVFSNNKRAGAGTETLSEALCTYLSVRIGEEVYGVVGIAAAHKPLDGFETSLLLSILGECALALENQKNREDKEAAAVLAQNEQLRANLLRSISHDLRTPLTSISGNAGNLLANGGLFDEKTKVQMYTDIYEDSIWLIDLVENLLSVSRLQGGEARLNLAAELVEEIVEEALRHLGRRTKNHQIQVVEGDEYALIQVDGKLLVQVLINLVDNAIKHTPSGSKVVLSWERQGRFMAFSVADNGPGVPDQAKPRIFDMFYSASHSVADSRRSMGLGLALCKSIVNAHGGEIWVADNVPQGAIFTFTVPVGEVEVHE